MPTRNVVITDQQAAMVEALVASGRYQNASEVLREGLRLIAAREAEQAERLAAIRTADPATGSGALAEERGGWDGGPLAAIPRPLLEAYSDGKISRSELERRAGTAVSFGDLLLALREARLSLPRPAANDSEGRRIVRALARDARR